MNYTELMNQEFTGISSDEHVFTIIFILQCFTNTPTYLFYGLSSSFDYKELVQRNGNQDIKTGIFYGNIH